LITHIDEILVRIALLGEIVIQLSLSLRGGFPMFSINRKKGEYEYENENENEKGKGKKEPNISFRSLSRPSLALDH
jgi:hypothetical protein